MACVDNSGSMSDDHETWSKAVALALLEIATMQNRGLPVFISVVSRMHWRP